MKKAAALLLGSTLLLASCNSTPSTPQPETVSGQVKELSASPSGTITYSSWTGGAGKVLVSVEGKDNLVTADLTADGRFSLTLPSLDAALLSNLDLTSDLPEGCTGSLTTSGASNARGNVATFRVQAGKSGEIAPAGFQVRTSGGTLESVSMEGGLYVYADKAAGLSGRLNCTQDGVPVTGNINVQLQAGWNKMTLTLSATKQGGTLSLKTGSLPAQWLYLENDSALSLGQQSLNRSAAAQPVLKVAQALPFFR
ncbi:hypothetical protein [Deinococcus sp. YIM 77859]|uniref:hypothetical protein n=1 Tax=Deinococcus sp. YIM 77859 TaxID=1540221 RepID=UPI000554FA64|nr:hypothetical protein [Deinococcus sp. YIM 77859]